MANPNPTPPPKSGQFQPGKSGNPAGKPKGIQSWSTVVRELLEDEKLLNQLVNGIGKGKKKTAASVTKPVWLDALSTKNAGTAIVTAMIIEAIGGNDKAATWLRRTGYGDKLDITNSDRTLKAVAIFDMRSGTPMELVPVKPPAAPRKPKPKAKKPVAKKKPATAKVK